MRGVGVTEWLAGGVPQAVVPVLVALTFLGDPVFLVGLAPLGYWLGPRIGVISRENGARLLAVTLGALALSVLLKYGFALPRPPSTIQLIPEDGFGFPSGHATGSAAVYGAFAALAHWRTRVTRYGLATGMIGLIALTRVLLGVHYVVDVATGALAGLLLALVVIRSTEHRVQNGFRLAALLGIATPLVAWPTFDAAAALGGAVGAVVAWELWGERILAASTPVSLPLAAVAFVGFGGIAGVTYVLEPAALLVVVVNAATGAGFVGLPVLQERLAMPLRGEG